MKDHIVDPTLFSKAFLQEFARLLKNRDFIEKHMSKEIPENPNTDAWSKQIGGTHYQDLAIQPMEYSLANNLNALSHSIVKYATRIGTKGNKGDHIKDAEKIIHCAQMYIEYLKSKEVSDSIRFFNQD